MTKLHKRIATSVATVSLIFSSILPAFAGDATFTISGNGSDSVSDIDLDSTSTSTVFQTNDSTVVNDITVDANTGRNDANDNTGGDVEVDTGDAEISASITNEANSNFAVVDSCDCEGDLEVEISGNGTGSTNGVDLDRTTTADVVQDNIADFTNTLDFTADSGRNDVNDNTGGDVSLSTGDVVIAPVEITNMANSNVAVIGNTSGGDSSTNLSIIGNGSDSINNIVNSTDFTVGLFQTNDSTFLNDVVFDANSGRNSVSDNTMSLGGNVDVETGDVEIEAYIDNAAGFNAATADCGCIENAEGLIEGNGTTSTNDLDMIFDNTLDVVQDNVDDLTTAGTIDGVTGINDTDDNTNGDLDVSTGDSSTVVEVSNAGGSSVFGDIEFELPWGWNFSLGL